MLSSRYINNAKPFLKLNKLQKRIKADIEEKINKTIYNFEETQCPVCKIIKTIPLAEKDRYGLYNPTVICKKCGLLFSNPRMSFESYCQFYEKEYRLLYAGETSFQMELFQTQMELGREIANFFEESNIDLKNKNIIEIGCGAGGILYYFQKNYNAKVSGCDLTSDAISYGKNQYELDLKHGNIEVFNQTHGIDIIIYNHVFEHILDINDELDKIKNLCNPQTLIYIEVPGIMNIRNAYYWNFLLYLQNAHVYHFSLQTLTNVLSKNGFIRCHGNEYIRGIFKINDNQYGKHIVNDYDRIIQFLKQTEKWRFLGYIFNLKKNILKFKYIIIKLLDFLHLKKFIKNLILKSKY